MNTFLVCAVILALIPTLNTLLNLFLIRAPRTRSCNARVSILIPARNEELNIGACIDCALASRDADIDVIVLDDHSSDRTAEIVRERMAQNKRLKLAAAPPLPNGWKGKTHACHILSTLATRPYFLFVDADVRLAPDAASLLVPKADVSLVSGVPRQVMGSPFEIACVPMIQYLIYAYLPIAFMRWTNHVAFGAACGQLIMVRADSYSASGGHAAIAHHMHDGLALARLFRRHGLATDLVDATNLASCRMYRDMRETWDGFSKNATEGLARPLALLIWTVLLLGGILVPLGLQVSTLFNGALHDASIASWLLPVTVALVASRAALAVKCREPLLAVVLFPLGVLCTLAIQYAALASYLMGKRVTWRGRTYQPSL